MHAREDDCRIGGRTPRPLPGRFAQTNLRRFDKMDHDRLFKELLTTFFVEFLELFFPDLEAGLDPNSIEFLDKEVFTDVTEGERREVDLAVKARFRDRSSFLLIHVETQAQPQAEFAQRMFMYFARLHEKYRLPVYPVALFTYDQPRRAEPDAYRVEFPDLGVLAFCFRVVQLNRLDWHGFVERTNPIAAALMAKMRMQPTDRPWVKLACLDLLGKLQLDPARRELISGFVDTYLRLTMEEQRIFEDALKKIEPLRQERIMKIVTSWMEKGIEQGMERGVEQGVKQGKQEEARALVVRMLGKRLGTLDPQLVARMEPLSVEQLEELAEALLDFRSHADLADWLDDHVAP
jgi:hypothetical protein